MRIFKEIEPLRAFLIEKRRTSISIGLVPTMGALHEGHLSLIRASMAENTLTVTTIYVNPTQFNNPADLDNYPRTLEADTRLLDDMGCDILFMPPNEEIYNGQQILKFDFDLLDKVLEGKFRPGHFSGVALIVSKLLNIVQPDRAYFGQKDYQQFQIISRLRDELKFNTILRSVPIVREASGLALSSRNQRLSTEAKRNALLLYESLKHIQKEIKRGIEFNEVKKEIEGRFQKEKNMKLEYLELANKKTLEPLILNDNLRDAIILIAAYVGEVRLIDNMIVDEEK